MEELLYKIDNGIELDRKDLKKLIGNFDIKEDYGENGRWTRSVTTICQLGERYFSVDWKEGLTEFQENEYCHQPIEVELKEYEKVVKVREWIPKNK